MRIVGDIKGNLHTYTQNDEWEILKYAHSWYLLAMQIKIIRYFLYQFGKD